MTDATQPPQVYYIDVQGNIGVGKSTTLAHVVPLLAHLGSGAIAQLASPQLVVPVQEPVVAFSDVRAGLDARDERDAAIVAAVPDDDASMLARMYASRPGSAALFQTLALTERVMAVRRAYESALSVASARNVRTIIIVTERSVDADAHIFARGLVASGAMDATEMCAYHRLARDWRTLVPPGTHLLSVYLRAEPVTCFERVRSRARDGESSVSLELLERLHAKHEALYGAPGARPFGTPVFVLDAAALGDVRTDEHASAVCAVTLGDAIHSAIIGS